MQFYLGIVGVRRHGTHQHRSARLGMLDDIPTTGYLLASVVEAVLDLVRLLRLGQFVGADGLREVGDEGFQAGTNLACDAHFRDQLRVRALPTPLRGVCTAD